MQTTFQKFIPSKFLHENTAIVRVLVNRSRQDILKPPRHINFRQSWKNNTTRMQERFPYLLKTLCYTTQQASLNYFIHIPFQILQYLLVGSLVLISRASLLKGHPQRQKEETGNSKELRNLLVGRPMKTSL